MTPIDVGDEAANAPRDPLAPLASALGAEPPPGLRALAPDDVAAIAAAVEAAVACERRALREALEDALWLVPRPLRPLVRRVVAG